MRIGDLLTVVFALASMADTVIQQFHSVARSVLRISLCNVQNLYKFRGRSDALLEGTSIDIDVS